MIVDTLLTAACIVYLGDYFLKDQFRFFLENILTKIWNKIKGYIGWDK